MDAAEIEVCDIKPHCREMVVGALAETIRQPREAATCHAKRQILAFDIAGRNLPRRANDRSPVYRYYVAGRVAPRGVDRRLAVVLLHDLAIAAVGAESLLNRSLVPAETVRRNFGRVDDALAQIPRERLRVFLVSLADLETDDRLRRCRHAEEDILVADLNSVRRRAAALLLADEGPRLVQLETRDLETMDRPVVKLDRAEADASGETHDRIAMGAGQALSRADGTALSEGTDDGDLLLERKDVHGANP